MTRDIKISAIVCTHNRCESLKDTLRSLQGQSYPATHYEIIVVDNDSSDETKRVVGQFMAVSPAPLQYVFEGRLGLSHARNTGIAHASGEIIAFIDDDALADKNWLLNLVGSYIDPKIDCVGGKVNLVSMAENPGWLHRKLLPYLGAFDYGTTHRLLSYPEYPYGLNMSFRKAVFGRIGFFRVDLGRTGDLLLSNEERDLCYRIEKSGGLIGYAPDAVVYHHIPTARLSKGWFLSRFYWQGRSDYVFDRLHFSHQHIRGQILKKAFRIAVGLAKLVFSREEDERFYRRCQIYACYGYLRQTGRKV